MLGLGFICVGELNSDTTKVWSPPYLETRESQSSFDVECALKSPESFPHHGGLLWPSTWEAEARGSWAQGQSVLHSNTLSQKTKPSKPTNQPHKQMKQDYCMDQRFDLTNCLLGKLRPQISQAHFLQMGYPAAWICLPGFRTTAYVKDSGTGPCTGRFSKPRDQAQTS